MSSQKSIPPSSCDGTLTPVKLIIEKRSELVVDAPMLKPTMVNVPQLTFAINENIKVGPSIIDTLMEENKPIFIIQKLPEKKPVVIFNEPSERDEIIEKLLQNGYVIDYRMYEGPSIAHLLARTRAGDNVIVKIDSSHYRSSFPKIPTNDIQLERKSAVVLVPQETKMSVLDCLNYDICGAAFICNNSICITEKKKHGGETSFVEENFVFRSQPSISGGKIGRNIMAYPIVLLSKILENPLKIEDQISEQSKTIADMAFGKLENYQKELEEVVLILQKRSKSLESVNNMVKSRLDKEILDLEKMYLRIRGVSPKSLPEDLQADYYLILRTLAEKKKIREKYLNGVANIYTTTGTIQTVSNDFLNSVDPIYNMYMESS